MHIHTAGMPCPHIRLQLASGRGQRLPMVLLHPHLPHGKSRPFEGAEQLVTGVEQALQPGPWSGPHREHSPQQVEGTAMGGELGTSQARPGLPKSSQVALPLPLLLEIVQTGGQAGGRRRGGRHQQGDIANPPALWSTLLSRTGRGFSSAPAAAWGGGSWGHGGSKREGEASVAKVRQPSGAEHPGWRYLR